MKKVFKLCMMLMMACCVLAMSGCGGDKFEGKWVYVAKGKDVLPATIMEPAPNGVGFRPSTKPAPIASLTFVVMDISKNGEGYLINNSAEVYQREPVYKNVEEFSEAAAAAGTNVYIEVFGSRKNKIEVYEAAKNVVPLKCDFIYTWTKKAIPEMSNLSASLKENDLILSKTGDHLTYVEKDKTLVGKGKTSTMIFKKYSESEIKKIKEEFQASEKAKWKTASKQNNILLSEYKDFRAKQVEHLKAGKPLDSVPQNRLFSSNFLKDVIVVEKVEFKEVPEKK